MGPLMELIVKGKERDAAWILLRQLAELRRYGKSTHTTLNVPNNLIGQIDLLLDLVGKPAEEL